MKTPTGKTRGRIFMSSSFSSVQPQETRKDLTIPFLLLIAVLGISAAIAGPRLIARLKLEREVATINSLRTIHEIEMQFKELNLRFATLEELAESTPLDRKYTGGKVVSGYVYSTSVVSAESYCVHAVRASDATAHGDFVVCEDGIIRFVEQKTPGLVKRGEGVALTSPY